MLSSSTTDAPQPQANAQSLLLGNISSLLNQQEDRTQSPFFQQQQQQQHRPAFHLPAAATNQSVPVPVNELFLRPTRANHVTRGKTLRIVDFVSRIRPSEDEKVLSYDNNCKLTLTLHDTKPKLLNVTVEQYNIANLRIFYG